MRLSLISLLFLIFSFVAATETQIPMDSPYTPHVTKQPTLSDILTIETRLSIFYSYARELSDVTNILGDPNAAVTILVPTNTAVMALARKPHQGPTDTDIKISEEYYDHISRDNVQQWIHAHIIPAHPIHLSSQTYDTMLNSRKVTFSPAEVGTDKEEWEKVTLEDGIRILGRREASNGVIYIIDGTIAAW